MKDNRIYVFLSHSHHDYEKVRVVRDLLEEQGFRPLMFFLKCLEKKEFEELTRVLITEEIESRQRFILCKSKNADDSTWVKFEVEYIKKLNRPYEVVDLSWPKEQIYETINKFRIRSTVFLSYHSNQYELARAVNDILISHDFKTFIDKDHLHMGDSYAEVIRHQIIESIGKGYVLVFLDDKFRKESWQFQEIKMAIEYSHFGYVGSIIPVVSAPLPPEANSLLGNLNWIDVQGMDIQEASDHVVKILLQIDSQYNQ